MSRICRRQGIQQPTSDAPSADYPIRLDERQYVGPLGQKWTSLDELNSGLPGRAADSRLHHKLCAAGRK